MKKCIATIVSANYLAYACVLAESVSKQMPGWDFKVLVVDRDTEEIRAAVLETGLDAIYASNLGLPDFEKIAFKYDIVEFNTALKPTFLKHLFSAGNDQLMYIDPDIRVYNALEPVTDALKAHEIILTPHALAPIMDSQRPSDLDFLRNGSFNLGFVALRKGSESLNLLDWWENRCLSYGFNDLGFGTFVDQKWMDLTPSYFGHVHILRDVTCNAAYWNLHERSVTGTLGEYKVNGSSLSFFHFSGVKAEHPGTISKHQTRHPLVEGTPLANLYLDYCNSLLRLGHEKFSQLKYSFGSFSDGQPITWLMRRSSVFENENNPFDKNSIIYKKHLSNKKQSGKSEIDAPKNTQNFDANSRQVAIVNKAVRIMAKLLGPDRLLMLLRYGAFLTRESNLSRVLAAKDFDLLHSKSRR